MNLRLLLILPLVLAACGMKGALERPSGPVPPPLYDQIFGDKGHLEEEGNEP
ncbi:MAG: lipoprotein [Betaproteobacteria bacterium]|nr:lipoprotein [Betaproteobacteria bacterium]